MEECVKSENVILILKDMKNNIKFREADVDLFMSAIITSPFFKEHLRKAWGSGRMFNMELYQLRNPDEDIEDVSDKALTFEEWFTRNFN